MTDDLVVLLDDDGSPIGTAPRLTVHGPDTPLHLAFSCHLLDRDPDRTDDGRCGEQMLMTRRALGKKTWPGVWTNSFCGHPRPGEALDDAVHRYAQRELGLDVVDLKCVLPDFRYRAIDSSGVVEYEVCPVFVARPMGEPRPNADEVMETAWVGVEDVWQLAERTPWAISPWLVEQVHALGAVSSAYA